MDPGISPGALADGSSRPPSLAGLLPTTDLPPLDKLLPWALDGGGRGGGDVHTDNPLVDNPINGTIIPQRGSRHGSGDTGHTSKQSCQGDGVTGGIKEKEDLGDTEEGDRAQGGWAGP